MDGKWIGAFLILAGCGFCGFSLASKHLYAEYCLQQLIRGLEYMTCELQFRMTPLAELCRSTSRNIRGPAGQALSHLAIQLDMQEDTDVSACMDAALAQVDNLPDSTRENLRILAMNLGRFDLEGQLQGLNASRTMCRKDLEALEKDRDSRLHSCRTLGLCTGAALAILLI